MRSTPPVRIRSDLHDWLSTQAASMGVSVPALLNTLVERESTLGRMFLVRPMTISPGLSDAAKELVDAPEGTHLIVAYNDGRGPWGWIVAGSKTAIDTTSLDLEIFRASRVMRVPRHFIFAWHICGGADFSQEILAAAYRYRELGMQLHPSVRLPHRESHGL